MFFYLLLLLLLLWCGGHCRIDAVVVAADRSYILAPIYTLVMFSTLLLHMQRLFCCLQFSCPFLSRISSVISLHLSNPFLATFNIDDDDDDDENTQPKLKTQQQIFSFLLNTNAKPCSRFAFQIREHKEIHTMLTRTFALFVEPPMRFSQKIASTVPV